MKFFLDFLIILNIFSYEHIIFKIGNNTHGNFCGFLKNCKLVLYSSALLPYQFLMLVHFSAICPMLSAAEGTKFSS